jgi:hypothetical protein
MFWKLKSIVTPDSASSTLNGYSHFTSCCPFTLNCSGICSQAGGFSADSVHRVHPTAFHTNVQWDPRTKLFLNTCLAGVQGRVCPCASLDAGVWILDPRCICLNWIAHGYFHSRHWQESKAGLSCRPQWPLNLGSSMHMFELNSAWIFQLQTLTLAGVQGRVVL